MPSIELDYKVLDHDFDAVSDSKIFWHACCEELGGWSNRYPASSNGTAPVALEPMMEVIPRTDSRRTSKDGLDEFGYIVSRRETFPRRALSASAFLVRSCTIAFLPFVRRFGSSDYKFAFGKSVQPCFGIATILGFGLSAKASCRMRVNLAWRSGIHFE